MINVSSYYNTDITMFVIYFFFYYSNAMLTKNMISHSQCFYRVSVDGRLRLIAAG